MIDEKKTAQLESENSWLKEEINHITGDLFQLEYDLIEEQFLSAKRRRALRFFEDLYPKVIHARSRYELLQEVVRTLATVIGYDRIIIYQKNNGKYTPVAQYGYQDTYCRKQLSNPFFAGQLQREPFLLVTGLKTIQPEPALLAPFQINYYAAVPFKFGHSEEHRMIFFIGNHSEDTARRARLDDDDIALLRALSRHIASALDNVQMLHKLESSEERYRQLFHNAAVAMFQADTNCTLLETNGIFQEMLGYEGTDSSERALRFPFVRKEDEVFFLERLRRDHAVTYFSTELLRKDGSRIEVLINAHINRSYRVPDRPNLRFFSGSVQDLTIQRINTRLQLEKRTAEAAEAAQRRFLDQISHDIRTPINAILGFTEILRSRCRDNDDAGRLAHIHRASDYLLRMFDNLLELSRIQRSPQKSTLQPFSPSMLLQDLEILFAPAAADKSLKLTFTHPDNMPPFLCGDRIIIRQILANLLGNAVKFTDTGSISLFSSWKEPGLLICTVKDSGPGIPADAQERVFTPFEQLDSPHRSEGTGLGLAIARQLTAQINGKLQLHSAPEIGSSFTLSVPAPRPDDATVRTVESWCRAADRDFSGKSKFVLEACKVLPERTASIRTALLRGDLDNAALYAHKLKGLCREMAMDQPGETAAAIERLCRSGKATAVELEPFMLELRQLADRLTELFPLTPLPAPKAVPSEGSISGPAKILVIDDTDLNRAVLIDQISAAGMRADQAAAADQALAMIRSGNYRLLLLDINMPGMDGIALLEQLERENLLDGVVIAIISGEETLPETLDRYQPAARLQKPVSGSRLAGLLQQCFGTGTQPQGNYSEISSKE